MAWPGSDHDGSGYEGQVQVRHGRRLGHVESGNAGQVLTSNGAGVPPSFQSVITLRKHYPVNQATDGASIFTFSEAAPLTCLVFYNGICQDDNRYSWTDALTLQLTFTTLAGDSVFVYY
jgi:hypothetical protein